MLPTWWKEFRVGSGTASQVGPLAGKGRGLLGPGYMEG